MKAFGSNPSLQAQAASGPFQLPELEIIKLVLHLASCEHHQAAESKEESHDEGLTSFGFGPCSCRKFIATLDEDTRAELVAHYLRGRDANRDKHGRWSFVGSLDELREHARHLRPQDYLTRLGVEEAIFRSLALHCIFPKASSAATFTPGNDRTCN